MWDFREEENIMRLVGNILTILGYYVLLHVDQAAGGYIKCVGFLLIIPFIVKYKLWDYLVVLGFFLALDISNLIKLGMVVN